MSQIEKRVTAVEQAVIKNLTIEQMEALLAGEPAINLDDFTEAELTALTEGYAPDTLITRYIERRNATQ